MSVKTEYCVNEAGDIVFHLNAVKGQKYRRIDEFDEWNYIVRDGEVNIKHFARLPESGNELNSLDFYTTGAMLSPAHYNFIAKICSEKKYFDTIFNKELNFNKCLPEISFKRDDYENVKSIKRPDIVCYDEKDNAILGIEVYFTNKKMEADIIDLKKIGIPIVEIKIDKDGNQENIKHLVLPSELEFNRQKYSELYKEYKELKIRIDEYKSESGKRISKYRYDNEQRIKEYISKVRKRYADALQRFAIRGKTPGELTLDIERENEYIQTVESEIKGTRKGIIEYGNKVILIQDEIKEYKKGFAEIRDNYARRVKAEEICISDISRIKTEIEHRKENTKAFIEDNGIKVEWFRNEWMGEFMGNFSQRLSEIRKWCS